MGHRLLLFADIPEKLARTYYPGVHMPPLGLCALAGYVRQECVGWEVHGEYLFATLDEPRSEAELLTLVRDWQPTLLGFTAMSANIAVVSATAQKLIAATGLPALLGGPHISTCPRDLPACFMAGVVGEGEATLAEVLARVAEGVAPAAAAVAGLVYRDGGVLRETAKREPLRPLDRVPPSAYDLFPPRHGDGLIYHSSRGCPYRCSFCNAAELWRAPRFYSAARVVDDMARLHATYGTHKVAFYDDLFIADVARVAAIADGLQARGLTRVMEFECLARANLVDAAMARELRRMNVTQVNLGVETGAQGVLTYLKGGGLTVDQIRAAREHCRAAGIRRVTGGFMVGTPGESADDLRASISFVRELDLYFTAVNLTTPYPGTRLWADLVQAGKIGADEGWSEELFGMSYYTDDELRGKRLFTDIPREEFITLYRALCDTADVQNARHGLGQAVRGLRHCSGGARAWLRGARSVARQAGKALQRRPALP